MRVARGSQYLYKDLKSWSSTTHDVQITTSKGSKLKRSTKFHLDTHSVRRATADVAPTE